MSIGNLKLLDKEESCCLKGLGAIGVMMGHITSSLDWYWYALFPGGLWVGVFFFFSGYGLHLSLRNKDYMDTFFIKKLVGVYFPFICSELAFTLIKDEWPANLGGVILKFCGLNLSNSVLWYVTELLVMSILFYIFYKTLKDQYLKYSPYIWLVVYFLFLAGAVIEDMGVWWYISSSTFVLGVFFCRFNILIRRIFSKDIIIWLSCAAFLVIYVVFYYIKLENITVPSIPSNYLTVFFNIILAPLFLLFIMSLVQLINIEYSFLSHLGNVSYEIYLWHIPVFYTLSHVIDNIYAIIVITIITTYFVARIINKLNSLVFHFVVR